MELSINELTVIKDVLDTSIKSLNEIYEILESYGLKDHLITLNWLDKINEISVRN